MNDLLRASFLAVALTLVSIQAVAVDWIRPGVNTDQPVWGIRGGLLFAIHPGGFSGGEGGPRGLIRLGYPTLTNGGYDLINFIAVEPVVKGRRGFSELEHSALDRCAGKRFWAQSPVGQIVTDSGVEQLEVVLFVERFDSGAHVRLQLRQRADAPDELRLAVETEPDSAPLDCCILTATMGNKARIRHLWLREGPVSSLQRYADFTGPDFAPHQVFVLDRLSRASNGDVLVAATTDEDNPALVQPFGRRHFWDYRGGRVTQYWRKAALTVTPDLHCAVNGRFTYWGSKRPIPGGVAFENFELQQKFRERDEFVFGITRRSVAELVPTAVVSRDAQQRTTQGNPAK